MTQVFDSGIFNAEATITTKTIAISATGNPSPADSTAYSGVRCTIQAMSSADALVWGKETGTTSFDFYCPMFLDDGTALTLQKNWTVTVGGVVYRVMGEGQDQGGRGLLQKAPLEVASR